MPSGCFRSYFFSLFNLNYQCEICNKSVIVVVITDMQDMLGRIGIEGVGLGITWLLTELFLL